MKTPGGAKQQIINCGRLIRSVDVLAHAIQL
jgi:hypothetical protein